MPFLLSRNWNTFCIIFFIYISSLRVFDSTPTFCYLETFHIRIIPKGLKPGDYIVVGHDGVIYINWAYISNQKLGPYFLQLFLSVN